MKRAGVRGHVPPLPRPTFFIGWAMVCLWPPPPPFLTAHFYFPLELYVYITLTNILCIFHIPINYLVDNFNKLTQMAVSK